MYLLKIANVFVEPFTQSTGGAITIKLLRLFLLLAVAIPCVSRAEIEDEYYLEFGDTCIKTAEPGLCMEAYGFQCDRIGAPARSVGAYMLGCNLTLSDGRKHFVQLLQQHGGWNVELQKTYKPDPVYVGDEQFLSTPNPKITYSSCFPGHLGTFYTMVPKFLSQRNWFEPRRSRNKCIHS